MKEHRTTKGKIGGNGVWWAGTLVAALAGAPGCADHVQSTVAVCPCDRGVCCSSGVCAADENACTQATSALSLESAGHWTGYIENDTLMSGSDALDLTLQAASDGTLSGQIILGSGTAPAPATDGSVGWPAGYTLQGFEPLHIGVIEGFGYTATNVRWTALRLRFEINLGEPWGPWCHLQQPYTWAPGNTTCVPDGGFGGDFEEPQPQGQCSVTDASGTSTPTDCYKLLLCQPESSACDCTDAGCTGGTTLSVAFDVALSGDEGSGSLVDVPDKVPGANDVTVLGSHNVRLIRASN